MKKLYTKISIDEDIGPPESDGKASKNDPNYIEEGVVLNEKEQEYLLPHFTLMVVGRPGSGKTYVIRQLLTEKGYYKGKFDKIFLMSPSAMKMGIPVAKKQMTQHFDLKWIEDQLMEINVKQKSNIQAALREAGLIDKYDVDRLNGKLLDEIDTAGKNDGNKVINVAADKERFFTHTFFKPLAYQQATLARATAGKLKKVQGKERPSEEDKLDLPTFVDDAHQKLVKKMTKDMRREHYVNALLILDDMVSQIKANEFNPLLTQLIFNRRHLIINGMLSIIIVAQKFTMIRGRIRSNASWLIMFKQNPADLLAVYKDVVQLYPDQWEQIVEFAFGQIEKNRNHLDIWIEKDVFFLNFQRMLFDQQSDMTK